MRELAMSLLVLSIVGCGADPRPASASETALSEVAPGSTLEFRESLVLESNEAILYLQSGAFVPSRLWNRRRPFCEFLRRSPGSREDIEAGTALFVKDVEVNSDFASVVLDESSPFKSFDCGWNAYPGDHLNFSTSDLETVSQGRVRLNPASARDRRIGLPAAKSESP